MAAPYDYEDLKEGHIKSLEALNNKYDRTGKLNELRIPPLRRQQRASRPLFYEPSQHSASPRLSATINGPPTLSLSAPYPVTITLHHHDDPTGDSEIRPITVAWKDTALDEISDTDIAPWLFLHHMNGNLKELDDGNNGPGFVEMISDSQEPSETPETKKSITLAADESEALEVNFRYTGEGLQLTSGEKYSIGFRGSRISTSEGQVVIIPASNLIEVSVCT